MEIEEFTHAHQFFAILFLYGLNRCEFAYCVLIANELVFSRVH